MLLKTKLFSTPSVDAQFTFPLFHPFYKSPGNRIKSTYNFSRTYATMSEILPIFHQSPPLYHHLHPHLQRDVLNVDSECNCSLESHFTMPRIDETDHFQCSEFAGDSFTDFSSSTVDELSKLTGVTEKKQSMKKRKLEVCYVTKKKLMFNWAGIRV